MAGSSCGSANKVQLAGIQKRFRINGNYLHVLNDIDMEVDPGAFVSIVGPSGCGKSSLLNILAGLEEPDSGSILIDGKILDERTLPSWQASLGYVPQASFIKDGSIAQNIAFGIKENQMDLERVKEVSRIAMIAEFIELELPKQYQTLVGERGVRLSGGQRQRIAIARALITRPALIVADEPVSALDVSVQAQVLNLMHDLQSEFGVTYLFISHDLAVVEYVCAEVAVMNGGKIVERGVTTEIFANPQDPYTRTLLDAVPKMPELSR